MSDIRVYELHASQRAAAHAVWATLESRIGHQGLTSSWLWTSAWLDAFGDLVPHLFLIAEDLGTPCAITLVTQGVQQRVGPVPVRSVHIGTGGEPATAAIVTEYQRLLVDETHRAAASEAFLRHLARGRSTWEEVVFDGMPPHDALPFVRQPGYWFVRAEVSRYHDLAQVRAQGGDVIASFGKNTRYSIRRSMRRFGELTIEAAATADIATDIFHDLVTLHQQHWQALGQPGAFAATRSLRFHHRLIPGLLERDALMLIRVRNAEQTIGCIYGFRDRNRMLMYQSGLMQFEDDKLKPGLVSHALAMQWCLDRGIDAYDFLIGDSRYKQELSNSAQPLVYAVLSRRTPKQALLRYARTRHYGPSLQDLTGLEGMTVATG